MKPLIQSLIEHDAIMTEVVLNIEQCENDSDRFDKRTFVIRQLRMWIEKVEIASGNMKRHYTE